MGTNIRWSPDRGANGDLLKSRDGRFVIIRGATYFTLLDKGYAIKRGPREDWLKEYADQLVFKGK